ncbi:MAG: amidase [Verrucomicrobia bacterium]|nr:MAG: amidase [Verrucomicrobiota bacterium]PYL33540.1 MAG: amidase [Verrucomicrobiota bacterium]
MNKQSPNRLDLSHTTTRRKFIGTTALSSAALLSGGLTSLIQRSASAAGGFDFIEKSIPELQDAMASGQITSRELTHGYIRRIQSLNPLLHSVIELNPNAIAIAAGLDNERRRGQVRGPLHGIPLLVKDNVATDDQMQTTAGSLAIYGNHVPGDAVIIEQLRAAGAIILGKSNLGEWANFRDDEAETYPLAVGWSARGDDTKNAYDLSYTSWGSSSGSANGAAANLCAAAIGTETDGSITGPSAVENIVGLKPTLGLVSQDGIIPIAHEQDTAGPMARSVTDVAILLGVLQSPFGEVLGHQLPSDYAQFLDPNALDGVVIGRDVRFFDYSYYGSGIPGDELTVAFAENALSVMESLGATVVDVDTGDVFAYNGDEFTALLYEFRAQIADYLATLTHTEMHTLADLIAFNDAHCPQEMPYYDQDVFLLSDQFPGYPNDPAYIAARTHARTAARSGIDSVINSGVDAIVAPHLTNSTGPAVAGYPNLSIPVGIRDNGRPAGMLMYSTFLHEPQLIGFGYALEQALNVRQQPQFLGSIIPIPNGGFCTGHHNHGQPHLPHGKIF